MLIALSHIMKSLLLSLAAEAEVRHAAGENLAEDLAGRVEDLNAGAGGAVDAPLAVDLQTVRDHRRDDGEEPLVDEMAVVGDVERADVVRQIDVVRARPLDGPESFT